MLIRLAGKAPLGGAMMPAIAAITVGVTVIIAGMRRPGRVGRRDRMSAALGVCPRPVWIVWRTFVFDPPLNRPELRSRNISTKTV